MNIFERLIMTINPKAALNRAYYRQLCRGYYEAAGRSRDGWGRSNATGELTDRMARDTVRARARSLERNDDSFKGIVLDLERNVVGTGAVLQAKSKNASGEENDGLNAMIEREWIRWCRKGACTVDGRRSFRDVQKLFVRRGYVDGGLLGVVCVIDGEYRLQLREVDDLDKTVYSCKKNRVIGGVEVDKYDAAVAYHFKRNDISGQWTGESERIPANRVIYFAQMQRVSQVREFSPAASCLIRMDGLSQLTDAAITKEKVQACFGVAIEQESTAPVSSMGRGVTPAGKPNEPPTEFLEPGMIKYLRPGEKVAPISSAGVSSTADGMIKSVLRQAGAGAGLSYEAATRDMSQVNYSSARQGMLQDRRTYADWQMGMIESVLDPIFCSWLEWAVLSERIRIPDYWDDPEKYRAHVWIMPGMDWIDPIKEANANKIALENNLTTLQQVCAAKGQDWREVVDQRARELIYIQKMIGDDTNAD